MNTQARQCQHGMTLIELVVAITVIGIAITSVLGVLSSISIRSADAMIREQAVAIGSAYLDEVLLKSFSSVPGGTTRANFNDVRDYKVFSDNGVHDQFGNAVNGLDQYQINVTVVASSLGTLPANQVWSVTVTVTHPSGVVVKVGGYRTLYP